MHNIDCNDTALHWHEKQCGPLMRQGIVFGMQFHFTDKRLLKKK